ncbi:MAG: carboxymuconolactone decarboxylase family protein [Elusimicrobia bacterium]|nr:carboxymuconolactone decarboxylase family protein [Elusimicrobiota bacterium]
MAHIPLPEGLPGILGPLAFRPETAGPLTERAQVLLRGPSPLAPGEREIIAAYVSKLNGCRFCHGSHAGAARALLKGKEAVVDAAFKDPAAAPISEKLRALLVIAGAVQKDGRGVTAEMAAAAKRAGADDHELHDTVLIAAAFCMYNRYVDGLATAVPPDAAYAAMGERLAAEGYRAP